MYVYQSFVRPRPEQFATNAEFNEAMVQYLTDDLKRVKEQRNEFEKDLRIVEKRIIMLNAKNEDLERYINMNKINIHERDEM